MSAAASTTSLAAAGAQFGRFTVLCEAPPTRTKSGAIQDRMVTCKCKCGTIKTVRLWSIRTGRTVSCGCLQREGAAALGKTFVKHGQSKTPVYFVWQAMIKRCHSPADRSYARYGAKGVRVCDEWRGSFENFLAYMGPRPAGLTLDRINSRGNYEPGNVRWATYKQQARNTSRNHLHTIDGVTRCLAEWCECWVSHGAR